MYVGSLFSGIGGIEIGFEKAGFKTAWFVEKEEYAQKILRQHYPSTKIYDDITQIDFETVQPIDVLTGGFPCQDISNAGKRAGIEGSRSSLWKYYSKAIRVLRPKVVFIENVSALTRRGLDVVLSDLASLGYDAEWHCVPASAVGANHQRDRIAILAYSYDRGCVYGQAQEFSAEGRQQTQFEFDQSSSEMAHTECERCNKRARKKLYTKQPSTERQNISNSSCKNEWNKGWWSVEPCLGRVADGVSDRAHRIKALGNAVVPQWAEVFAQAIKEADKEE